MGASFGSFIGIQSNISTNYNKITNEIQQTCNVTSSANTSNNNFILNNDDGVTISTINLGSTNCDLASVMSNNVANGTSQATTDSPSVQSSVPGIGVMSSMGLSFNVSTNITSTLNTNSALCNAASSANFTNNNVIITNSKNVNFTTSNSSPTQCSMSSTVNNMVQNTTGQTSTMSPQLGSSIVGAFVAIAAIAMIGVVLSSVLGKKTPPAAQPYPYSGYNPMYPGGYNPYLTQTSKTKPPPPAATPTKTSALQNVQQQIGINSGLQGAAVQTVQADPQLLLAA